MPVDNFDFAMLPAGATSSTLKELGVLSSDLENIDYSIVSWLKENLRLRSHTNEGFTEVPVLWQAPERAYQIKNDKALRDDGGALKMPLLSIERTGIVKDPSRKGGFQAHIYASPTKEGRTGRMVVARRIVPDKTRDYSVATGARSNVSSIVRERWHPGRPKIDDSTGKKTPAGPRSNKSIVIQYLSIPIPIYVNVEYKIVIKSEYQQQMNELLTPFIVRPGQINSFLLRRNGHLYEAFVDQNFNHNNNINDLGEDSRQSTTEFTIRILGYLIGEGPNDDRQLVRIHENAVTVTYPQESVESTYPGADNFLEVD